MPKVANCPLCKKKPYPYHYEEDHIGYVHCGVKCEDEDTWNRYAAAMELAEAKAWQQEVWEALRKPWDFAQVLRERKSIESICDIFEKSEVDAKSAEKRVLEVFK